MSLLIAIIAGNLAQVFAGSAEATLAALEALTLVAGVPESFRARSWSRRRYFFFSFFSFLLEVLPTFSGREECGCEECEGLS